MEMVHILSILAPLFVALAYIQKDIRDFKNQIREDMNRQSERTDKLYGMFIELLKGRKNDI